MFKKNLQSSSITVGYKLGCYLLPTQAQQQKMIIMKNPSVILETKLPLEATYNAKHSLWGISGTHVERHGIDNLRTHLNRKMDILASAEYETY